jgi:hypothetical protein
VRIALHAASRAAGGSISVCPYSPELSMGGFPTYW